MNKVFPSSKVDNFLPNFIVDQYPKFVQFIERAKESDERMGFSQDILQNLISYKNLDVYSKGIVSTGFLNVELGVDDDFIELIDVSGFPLENGIVFIDDEIILYRNIEGNRLTGLQRGSSGTVELATLTNPAKYVNTAVQVHTAGSAVKNLSALFFVGILTNIHNTYTDGLDVDRIFKEINKKTIVSNIKEFFRSKGTKLGIISLFKILYGNSDVNVEYPGDQIMIASESTWDENLICRTVPVPSIFYTVGEIPTNPGTLLGSNFEFRSFNDDVVYATGSIEYTSKYPFNDDTQYDLIINEDNFSGKIVANPTTTLTRELDIFGGVTDYRDVTTISVSSTLGFPESGIVFIENEAIYYGSKSTNQLFNCTRGYIGVESTHAIGSVVRGPYYIRGEVTLRNEEGTYISVSRSWPNNIITSVEVLSPGLLHDIDDPVTTEYAGRKDPSDPIVNSWAENSEDVLATQNYVAPVSSTFPRRGDVRDITAGIDSVYFDENLVYVSNTGLPYTTIGTWSTNGIVGPDLLPQSKISVFPKRRSIRDNDEGSIKKTGLIGLTKNGTNLVSNTSNETIVHGTITKFNILNSGSGYVNPTVVIDPDNTSAAAVIIDGKVFQVNPTSDDVYFSIPTARISSGEDAVISLTYDQFGRVIGANVVDGGRYYIDKPILSVIDYSERGRGATLSCVVSAGVITSVSVLTPGIDYKPATTYVDVTPIGSGAVIEPVVETYTRDLIYQIGADSNLFLDSADGHVFDGEDGRKSLYGIAGDPAEYRATLSDDGSSHSPLIGWAFDGNPIYGPYGYVNTTDDGDGVIRQKSRYILATSRIGFSPPSEITYPLGTFIEDYIEDDSITALQDTLDANNGKVCNTPEFDNENYPNGVYCYFITVSDTNVPLFPYIIGKSFQNKPLSQDVKLITSDVLEDVHSSTTNTGNTDTVVFDYNKAARRNSGELDIIDNSELSISQISTGSISGVSVQNRQSVVSVGDIVYFDDRGTGGTGADARVSWIVGRDVVSASSCSITTRVVSHRQRISLANNPDKYDFVFLPGQFIESISSSNKARGIVYSWDPATSILIVQVTTTNLFQRGDKFFDKKYTKRYSNRLLRGLDIPSPPFIDSSLEVLDTVDSVKPSTQSSVRNTTPNSVLISSTSPNTRYNGTPLIVGDLWWSTNTGRMYVYYGVLGNFTWVQTTPFGSIPSEFSSDSNVGYGYSDPYIPNASPVDSGRVLIADTAPSRRSDDSPVQVGDLWWSSITGNMYIWTGPNVTISGVSPCDGCGNSFGGVTKSYWVITDPSSIRSTEDASDQIYVSPGNPEVIVSSGNIGVVVSPDAPLTPNNGDLWFSSSSGKMYVYYVDVWAVVNPSAMTSSPYSRVYDGTLGENAPSVVGPEDISYNGFTGPISTIDELKETTEIFLESTKHFFGGDTIEIGDLLTHIETARITQLNVNKSRNSVFLQRGLRNTLNTIPNSAVVVNRSRYIFTVKTDMPHNLSVGDTVILDSIDEPGINGRYEIVSAGTLSNATATVTISGGQIASITITDGGANYEKNIQFEINLSGGGGAGAYAIAQTNDDGEVESAFVVNGGFGYTSVPTAEFLPGCNNTLFSVYVNEPYPNVSNLTYTTNAIQVEGYADTIDILSGGMGYTSLPRLPGYIRREIDRASVRINMEGTTIESVDILNGGNRYYSPQLAILTENNLGSGADLSVTSTDGRIMSITVNNGGIGYENPTIIIYEPNQIIPLTTNIGKINSFVVNSSGRYIKSDKTIRPQLDVRFKLVLEYDYTVNPYADQWLDNPIITQGTSIAVAVNWDPQKQILEVFQADGKFVAGKPIRSGILVANVLISGQSNQEMILSGTAELNGRFISEKSHISSASSYIQDGFYYQLFSYVIESAMQRKDYRDDVNRIIHPAGFIYFAKTLIEDIVEYVPDILDAEIDTLPECNDCSAPCNILVFSDLVYDDEIRYEWADTSIL